MLRTALHLRWFIYVLLVVILMSPSCTTAVPSPTHVNQPFTVTVSQTQSIRLFTTDTSIPSPISTLKPETETPYPTVTLKPEAWQEMPVIPDVSDTVRLIYQRGIRRGVNPNAFSKIGDCESRTTWFLYDFDQGPKYYDLGPYTYLEPVI